MVVAEKKMPKPAVAPAKSVPYLKLYRCADGMDIGLIVLGILGAAVNGATLPLFALVFGELIDTFGEEAEYFQDDVNQIALYFLYLALATLVASFLAVSMFTLAGIRQTARLRQEYLEAALRQDISYYDTDGTSGDVLSALNEDCTAVQNAIGSKVGNVIQHIVSFFVAIGISLYRGWELTLVMIALMPLIAVAGAAVARVQKSGGEKMADALAVANTASAQAIANIRTVASFSAEDRLYEAYKALMAFPTSVRIKLDTYGGLASGTVNAVVFFTYGVAFYYGAKLVRENNDYTGGIVMNVIFGAIIGGFALGQAAPNFTAFTTGCTSAGRLMSIIDRKPAIDVRNGGNIPKAPLKGTIELRGVNFAYAARPDVTVFKSLDLTIEAGQTVALVGASGCGKSTVIQLVERFYDPAAGSVCVDGMDIRSLDLAWYRSQVGLVSQEPTLFATTIKANILLGRSGASESEVREAAKAANAHTFIMNLPEGYDTQVGERGVQLSGGQKQRIAIARALLKNPRIMLLDEATSALDTRSERLVQAALDKLAVGRTTVVVAHRLSTIRNADQIAVVQGGAIVEKGTHSELYGREDSVYHSLVRLQQQAGLTDLEDAPLEEEPFPACAAEREVAGPADSGRAASQKGRLPSVQLSTGHQSVDLTSNDNAVGRKTLSKQLDDNDDSGAKAGKDKTEEEKAVKVPISRLLRMNAAETPALIAGCAASAVLGAAMPMFALLLGELIGVFFEEDLDKAKDQALVYSMLFFALGVAFFVFSTVQGYSFARCGSHLAERVRLMLYRAILHMEVGWFDVDSNTSGALVSRLSSDAGSVRGAAGDVLGMVLQNLTTMVAGYIIAFISGWRMTLVVTAVLPLLGFSSYMEIAFFFGLDGSGDEFSTANQTAFEAIQAIRTVHSYALEHSVARIYSTLLEDSHKAAQRGAMRSGLAFGSGQFITFAVYALSFWFGGKEVEKGRMNLEEMLKVFFAILLAAMGAAQAQIAFPDLAKGKAAVARVFRIVDRKSLIDPSDDAGNKPEAVKGEVVLSNVSFAYPSRPDVMVFNNFSLRVPAGKVTALVGESGSGKSTIINLVERFYDVQSGQVLLDGVDVRQLSTPWLRQTVGLVAQEPALFNGTILDNIKFGKPDASMEEVISAAQVANALEFIERQPDKFGTLLGEGGGISLSGGQKQRIAIARAVLKDPRVLLLDEATSALDAESERLVQDALDKLMVGRTSIVIAHRLTTVRNADKIAVVQRGQVLEEGTHDELMAKGTGAYVQLARAQAGQSFT